MSASTVSTVRPGYGSRWTATVEPGAGAAAMTAAAGVLGEPQPHHEVTTSCDARRRDLPHLRAHHARVSRSSTSPRAG